MRIATTVLVILIGGAAGLVVFNHYDVQARGNGPDYDPAVKILRTPDARFDALADFRYEPRYVTIEDPELGALRVHYVDEGPARRARRRAAARTGDLELFVPRHDPAPDRGPGIA